jgi:hypothetical protein
MTYKITMQTLNPNTNLGDIKIEVERGRNRKWVAVECPYCQVRYWARVDKNRPGVKRQCLKCSARRNVKRYKGSAHASWKGGYKKSKNYVWVYITPDCPFKSMAYGNYIPEHRLVMANHIGRPLDISECVHHINGNEKDNRIENLCILTLSEHTKLHNQLRSREN